ncbi:MAG: hypothetical protein BMS9Abin03_534 [Thermodesulfobacteriota bacterium]|nr:MAG: hypothetical protein BMS9Abin03_534 [Thermodesulfobacteriota bacterium]
MYRFFYCTIFYLPAETSSQAGTPERMNTGRFYIMDFGRFGLEKCGFVRFLTGSFSALVGGVVSACPMLRVFGGRVKIKLMSEVIGRQKLIFYFLFHIEGLGMNGLEKEEDMSCFA